MTDLGGTPYTLVQPEAMDLHLGLVERVRLLRSQGTLSDETLRGHFGNTRFEQIAESNAIEGSTLSVHETELAVVRGISISGHDPRFVADARNLAIALDRVVELARTARPLSVTEVSDVHVHILGDQVGAGVFRREPVRIKGSDHRPPKTWEAVMEAMDELNQWSVTATSVPPMIRGIVFHTWLTHIHPYVDGNGRVARAMLNLELIRAGYPVVTLRAKDRQRYYAALAESDIAGDLTLIAELIVQRASDSLLALERSAKLGQNYDPIRARIRARNEERVEIWNSAVQLLYRLVREEIADGLEGLAHVSARWYDGVLAVDDYASLSEQNPAGNSWAFEIQARTLTGSAVSFLAWIGFRSSRLDLECQGAGGPSLYWSKRSEAGLHPWRRAFHDAPGGSELTLDVPQVDRWTILRTDGTCRRLLPTELAHRIATDICSELAGV